MNRKLHHTTMALSIAAAVFTVLLLAGGPVRSPTQSRPAVVSAEAIDAASNSELPDVSADQRRHLRHSRALLALPYFSFAQGLRRNRS